MKLIIPFLLFITLAWDGVSQSGVTLSALQIVEMIDPGTLERNGILIKVSASDPAALSKLEVVMEEPDGAALPTTRAFSIATRDGKVSLLIDNYAVAFEKNQITFLITTRDQNKKPYSKIRIRGVSQSGSSSNELIHDRLQ
jgi:hypothetical protein